MIRCIPSAPNLLNTNFGVEMELISNSYPSYECLARKSLAPGIAGNNFGLASNFGMSHRSGLVPAGLLASHQVRDHYYVPYAVALYGDKLFQKG